MVENSNEKLLTKKVVLNSFKILAKTLILLIFVFFYIISTMFFLAPKFDAKIFNFFGLKKAEEACYVQAYEKSENNADLYNLILFESELQNYEKELYYLNLLMNDDEYDAFCKKLDDSALQTIKDKALVVYLCNVDGYLVNQKVKCMYELGFDGELTSTIRNFLKAQLENGGLFETSFATYVELIYSDEALTKEQKSDRFELAYNRVDTDLSKRLADLNAYVSRKDISLANKIIAQNAIVSIKKADYIIDKVNESAEVESSKAAYEAALAEYSNLVK